MARVELVMPKMGESIMEATILKWRKKPGERVELDEPVLDIATDKVDSEVPSPVEGILVEILFPENEVVAINKTIAVIETEAANAQPAASPALSQTAPSNSNGTHSSTAEAAQVPYLPTAEASAKSSDSGRFYSPLVRTIAKEEGIAEQQRLAVLRDKLWAGLCSLEQVFLNGDDKQRIAGNVNVSFNFVEGESLIMALKDIAVSSGSACTSASLEPSYVLRALGLSDELAHSSIRFTIGRFTTEEDIDFVINHAQNAVNKLRDLSPLWDMYKEGIDLSQVQWAAH